MTRRLPVVGGDDGTWGTLLNDFLSKEHHNTGGTTLSADHGGHKTITIRAGTATAGTAPLKFTSGTLLSAPEAGAMEFLTDKLYFTVTTSAVRNTIALYDDSSGATGDIYYRNNSGAFTRLAIGATDSFLRVASGIPSWSASDASTTAKGVAELATAAETTTGTDATRVVTPDGLAGSDFGKRVVQVAVTDPNGTALTTGDGKAYFAIPGELSGYNLVDAEAAVTTTSSSGLPTIQIARIRTGTGAGTVDMLTTRVTIDAAEFTSFTAATPPVVNASNDDVLANATSQDILRIDVDVAGTGTKGLMVILVFQLP